MTVYTKLNTPSLKSFNLSGQSLTLMAQTQHSHLLDHLLLRNQQGRRKCGPIS
jgi:hypothetical protein